MGMLPRGESRRVATAKMPVLLSAILAAVRSPSCGTEPEDALSFRDRPGGLWRERGPRILPID